MVQRLTKPHPRSLAASVTDTAALSERDFNDDGAFNIFQAHSNLDYRESTLSSGFAHTCAILDNGAVSCWGRGDAGQQGNGWSDKTTPTLTSSLGTGRTAVALSSGDSPHLRHPRQRCCVVLGTRKLRPIG